MESFYKELQYFCDIKYKIQFVTLFYVESILLNNLYLIQDNAYLYFDYNDIEEIIYG